MSGPREKVAGLRPAAVSVGLRRFAAAPGGGSAPPNASQARSLAPAPTSPGVRTFWRHFVPPARRGLLEDPRTQRAVGAACLLAVVLFALGAGTLGAQEVPEPRLDGAEPAVRQRLASLQADLRADPGNGDAWGRYGMVLEAHTFTDEAIAAYGQAHELSPRTFRWPYLLAALIDERSAADSLPLYRAALALDPDYAPGRVRFAEALERTGQFDAAGREYAQAARLDPVNAHAQAGLGRLALADGDADAAVRRLSRARELAPENRSFAVTLAQAHARAGDRDAAGRSPPPRARWAASTTATTRSDPASTTWRSTPAATCGAPTPTGSTAHSTSPRANCAPASNSTASGPNSTSRWPKRSRPPATNRARSQPPAAPTNCTRSSKESPPSSPALSSRAATSAPPSPWPKRLSNSTPATSA